jgi:hypothetical protein
LQAAEVPRVALGSALDAAQARALLAAVPKATEIEDMDALLASIHATSDSAERGKRIGRYLAVAAEQLPADELQAARTRLAASFEGKNVTSKRGAIR